MSQSVTPQRHAFALVFAITVCFISWTPAFSQIRRLSDRLASRKQDLPPPELEHKLNLPEEGAFSPTDSKGDSSGGSASVGELVTDDWSGDEVHLGNEFSDSLSLDESGTSWDHEMPTLQSSGTWLWRGHWYTEQSLVLMYRAMPNNKILTRDQTFTQRIMGNGQSLVTQSADNQDPLQTAGQTFKAEPGLKITIGNIIGRDRYNRDHAIEFSFLGFFDFDGRDRTVASQGPGETDGDFNVIDLTGSLFRLDALNLDPEVGPTSGLFQLPISVVGFSNALAHSYLFESDINSAELNFKRRSRLRRDRIVLQPNGKWNRDVNSGAILTLLGGLRMIRHTERILWQTSGAVDSTPLLVNVSNGGNPNTLPQITVLSPGGNDASGRFDMNAENDMFGVQLGADLMQQRPNYYWGIKLLGGALQNYADRQIGIDVIDQGATSRFTDHSADDQFAFLSEAGAYVGWQIRPNVTLKVSYDLLYYTGIVLARDGIEINASDAQQTVVNNSMGIPGNVNQENGFVPANLSGTFRPLEVRGDALYHAIRGGFEFVW